VSISVARAATRALIAPRHSTFNATTKALASARPIPEILTFDPSVMASDIEGNGKSLSIFAGAAISMKLRRRCPGPTIMTPVSSSLRPRNRFPSRDRTAPENLLRSTCMIRPHQ